MKKTKRSFHLKKFFLIFHENKRVVAVFSALFSLLLVIGSTYAWQTYSDERLNRVAKEEHGFSATIIEKYQANFAWEPGTTVDQQLQVKNDSTKSPAFVRVSLYDYFLSFEQDLSDGEGKRNGGNKLVNASAGTDIKMTDLSTWAIGHTYKWKNEKYFVANEVYKSDKENISTAYQYKGTSAVAALDYLTIQFNDAQIYDQHHQPPAGATDYWYFDGGYFYYSDVLFAGTSTSVLIEKFQLSHSLPNQYKGALYQLIPVMEAHDRTAILIEDWQLSGTYMEQMYQDKIG